MCLMNNNFKESTNIFREGHEFSISTIGEQNLITSKFILKQDDIKERYIVKPIHIKNHYSEGIPCHLKKITNESLKLSIQQIKKEFKDDESEDSSINSKHSLEVEREILNAIDIPEYNKSSSKAIAIALKEESFSLNIKPIKKVVKVEKVVGSSYNTNKNNFSDATLSPILNTKDKKTFYQNIKENNEVIAKLIGNSFSNKDSEDDIEIKTDDKTENIKKTPSEKYLNFIKMGKPLAANAIIQMHTVTENKLYNRINSIKNGKATLQQYIPINNRDPEQKITDKEIISYNPNSKITPDNKQNLSVILPDINQNSIKNKFTLSPLINNYKNEGNEN